MENLRFDPRTALTLADDRQRSVRAKVRRRPRSPWAPQPRPRLEHGVTATPQLPAPQLPAPQLPAPQLPAPRLEPTPYPATDRPPARSVA